ncbi:transporter [Enorma burkinafasonensis]|uniref:transporter n=1 Tax=Enorma burkinafasonensis TaxID=2590867 RepID=UPI0026EF40DC|nr:transporter [Enorma burkinafasonensis]MCI7730153.1 triose-phosphate transporter family protein [Enorma burkinafasonensis]
MKNTKAILGLHGMLVLYSLSSICGKLASGFPFLSAGFIVCYGGMIALLGIYALGWQQVIKRLPLTFAYANRAVTVVWGIVWGALFFSEPVTAGKLAGALIVLAGVVLYATSGDDAQDGSAQQAGSGAEPADAAAEGAARDGEGGAA